MLPRATFAGKQPATSDELLAHARPRAPHPSWRPEFPPGCVIVGYTRTGKPIYIPPDMRTLGVHVSGLPGQGKAALPRPCCGRIVSSSTAFRAARCSSIHTGRSTPISWAGTSPMGCIGCVPSGCSIRAIRGTYSTSTRCAGGRVSTRPSSPPRLRTRCSGSGAATRRPRRNCAPRSNTRSTRFVKWAATHRGGEPARSHGRERLARPRCRPG